jgi:hypothetical protein
MRLPRVDTFSSLPKLRVFRGVPGNRAEKNPLNLIRVMPAKGRKPDLNPPQSASARFARKSDTRATPRSL